MSSIKEKSAVGAATPATEEIKNITTDIISDESGKIKMIPMEKLRHHPDNPRKDIGDISELTESIKKNGIMQNLTVVPEGDRLLVLIGNRRFEAAKAAGLKELPCKIAEGLSKAEQVGIMLEENMQRNDLTVIEQAQGFQLMLDMGETVQSIAQRTGFSESTVRRRVKINELDSEALAKASESFQLSISDLSELEKIEDVDKKNSLLKNSYSHDNFKSSINAAIREQDRKKGIDRITARLREMGFKKGNYKQSEIWGKYEIVKRWAYNADPEKIKDIKNTGEMGYGILYGEVYLLKKPQRMKKKELTPEEKKQQEIAKKRKQVSAARNQMLNEFRDFLKGKFRDTGILRHNDNITERENREAWEVLCGFGIANIYKSVQCEALLAKRWPESSDEEKEMAERQLSRVPVAYQMAWAFCNDIKNSGGSYELMNYNGAFWKKSARIHERLYLLLRIWGFRFAEEEEEEFEELLDGTSELYTKEETNNA